MTDPRSPEVLAAVEKINAHEGRQRFYWTDFCDRCYDAHWCDEDEASVWIDHDEILRMAEELKDGK